MLRAVSAAAGGAVRVEGRSGGGTNRALPSCSASGRPSAVQPLIPPSSPRTGCALPPSQVAAGHQSHSPKSGCLCSRRTRRAPPRGLSLWSGAGGAGGAIPWDGEWDHQEGGAGSGRQGMRQMCRGGSGATKALRVGPLLGCQRPAAPQTSVEVGLCGFQTKQRN